MVEHTIRLLDGSFSYCDFLIDAPDADEYLDLGFDVGWGKVQLQHGVQEICCLRCVGKTREW